MGIIDYIRKFTLDKQLENLMKVGVGLGRGKVCKRKEEGRGRDKREVRGRGEREVRGRQVREREVSGREVREG